jgi:L-cysteine desulfidase
MIIREMGDLSIINENSNNEKLDFLNLDSILEFIQKVDINKLNLVVESIKMNKRICLESLNKPYGLRVGMSIKSQMEHGFLSNDIANYATALTAAGSDARMAGSELPVMSNSGSGNQGISATIPVVAFAEV